MNKAALRRSASLMAVAVAVAVGTVAFRSSIDLHITARFEAAIISNVDKHSSRMVAICLLSNTCVAVNGLNSDAIGSSIVATTLTALTAATVEAVSLVALTLTAAAVLMAVAGAVAVEAGMDVEGSGEAVNDK